LYTTNALCTKVAHEIINRIPSQILDVQSGCQEDLEIGNLEMSNRFYQTTILDRKITIAQSLL